MKLKIGGHSYRVEYTDLRSKLESGECGKVSREKGIIYIDNTLIKSEQDVALIHEIFHILNTELNHELLESLSQQLFQVMKDNKLGGCCGKSCT